MMIQKREKMATGVKSVTGKSSKHTGCLRRRDVSTVSRGKEQVGGHTWK